MHVSTYAFQMTLNEVQYTKKHIWPIFGQPRTAQSMVIHSYVLWCVECSGSLFTALADDAPKTHSGPITNTQDAPQNTLTCMKT